MIHEALPFAGFCFWLSILAPRTGSIFRLLFCFVESEGVVSWIGIKSLVGGLRPEVVEVDPVEFGLHALLVDFHLLLLDLHLDLLQSLLNFGGALLAVLLLRAAAILKF